MTAENQPLEVPVGDTLVFYLPVTSDGEDVPLDGAQVQWWLGRKANSHGADVVLKKSIGNGITVDGSTATVTLTATDTRAFKPGFLYHQAKVIFANGVEKTTTTGPFEFKPAMGA